LDKHSEFKIYIKELIEWNERFNLTAITDEKEIYTKHFLDSLTLLEAFDFSKPLKVIDIGTGAGFPGLPLKIVCPQIELTLLDSVKKKTIFLRHLVEVLKLEGVEVVWGRAEEIAKERRESFDLALSRAVAKLPTLVELALPLVKVGGFFIAMKEAEVDDELKAAQNAICSLGGVLDKVQPVKIPETDIARSLVLIKKTSPTPPHFPRRPGMANKRPL
jgi:16S rRNA (guanine527-N7)-methyltransferase